MKALVFALVGMSVIGCSTHIYQPTSTSLLKPIVGYKGDMLGAVVDNVETVGDTLKVTVDFPEEIGHLDNFGIENQHNEALKQVKPYQVLRNEEGQSTGLIIYLDKKRKQAFKIVSRIED